jgi:hypothetical protein
MEVWLQTSKASFTQIVASVAEWQKDYVPRSRKMTFRIHFQKTGLNKNLDKCAYLRGFLKDEEFCLGQGRVGAGL